MEGFSSIENSAMGKVGENPGREAGYSQTNMPMAGIKAVLGT